MVSKKVILDEQINQLDPDLVGKIDILVDFDIYESIKHLIVNGMYRGFRIVC